jgi:hypothetical protein
VHLRSTPILFLALAGASLAGMAFASAGWRFGLGVLAVGSAGVFGGLLDGEGPAAPRGDAPVRPAGGSRVPKRTIMLLGALTYLVIVPVLGFATRGLEELGAAPQQWWILATIEVSGLLAAFFGARRWRREHLERALVVSR